ncbi:MAG TPA: 50S ribosomal protein L7 [Acholeplasmataceae bacterium]|jgi:ribosomal protein L7Ae-like RNA K-turn-binding protein|nr:50S ribosomal protein L7 [Acholeplasmataceae bacterium]
MNRSKVLGYLGLARRANRLIAGSDAALWALSQGKARLVFIASDAARNTVNKFANKCHASNVPMINEYSSEELSKAIGKTLCKVLTVTDRGFSQAILGQLNGGIK